MSEFERWADGIADVVSTTLQRAIDSAPLTPMLSFDSQRVAHGDFILGTAPPIKDLELLRADLTADLSLAVVSAEAMVEHLAAFQLQSPQMTFIPVGCANTSVGYIPTSRIASEGGYEGGECLAYFDVRGRFSERADQIFYGAVLGLENVRRRSVATTN
ncbi:MAG: hypothetical protein ABI672_01205 [Vicinamibacteria bacterium]